LSVTHAPRFRRRRVVVAGVVLTVAGLLMALGVVLVTGSSPTPVASGPPCQATVAGTSVGLELDQAQNATTIAAVGKRAGLPDHAVTVALATAMQESQLRNLDYGDRDSLGLFQQRPSQGWGTATQVMSPQHAAEAFYQHLTKVPGWQAMAVTEAAQRVQHSGAPSAYSRWEADARVLAQALTGEVPVGLACRVALPKGTSLSPSLSGTMTGEVGPAVAPPAPSAQGWTTATWLVGHAQQFGVASVAYGGQRWSAVTGVWSTYGGPGADDGGVHVA